MTNTYVFTIIISIYTNGNYIKNVHLKTALSMAKIRDSILTALASLFPLATNSLIYFL